MLLGMGLNVYVMWGIIIIMDLVLISVFLIQVVVMVLEINSVYIWVEHLIQLLRLRGIPGGVILMMQKRDIVHLQGMLLIIELLEETLLVDSSKLIKDTL